MGRKRLLLLQDGLPPFRKPVYNGLADYYDVTVVHSGEPRTNASDRFREVVHPVRRRGPLWIRDRTTGASGEPYDVAVSMFNLRWPDCILPPLRDRPAYGRWILWGHGYGRSRLAKPARDWLAARVDGVYAGVHVRIRALREVHCERRRPRTLIGVARTAYHCLASRLAYATDRPFAVAPKAGAVWPGHERRCRTPRDVDVPHHETPISY